MHVVCCSFLLEMKKLREWKFGNGDVKVSVTNKYNENESKLKLNSFYFRYLEDSGCKLKLSFAGGGGQK